LEHSSGECSVRVRRPRRDHRIAFIRWFLLQAATAEARYIATEQVLAGVRVRDLMIEEPVTVSADMSLGQFMDKVAWSATPS
jgi:hypothetical protein